MRSESLGKPFKLTNEDSSSPDDVGLLRPAPFSLFPFPVCDSFLDRLRLAHLLYSTSTFHVDMIVPELDDACT